MLLRGERDYLVRLGKIGRVKQFKLHVNNLNSADVKTIHYLYLGTKYATSNALVYRPDAIYSAKILFLASSYKITTN